MGSLNMTVTDEVTMRLVHYLVTKENYQPIIVAGLDNEIWLENVDKKYGVIRINSNYIHNKEQLDFDIYKAKAVVKQIKRKTLSFKCDILSILLNVNDGVDVESFEKHVDVCSIKDIDELENKEELQELFGDIKDDVIEAYDDMDFFINVTNDINSKTEEKNRLYEKTFMEKPLIVTFTLIIFNVLIFLLSVSEILDINEFCMNYDAVRAGEWWRLITAAFFHGGAIHLFCNMYSLFILGTQMETVLGKGKFLVIYLASAFVGSLFSGVLNGSGVMSIGASGAIFGLMGAMLYFGYHYRLYLGSAIIYQLLPVLVLNLFIGLWAPGVDLFAHIGGLIGGGFTTMIVGIKGKTDKSDTINGLIVTAILVVFMFYMLMR